MIDNKSKLEVFHDDNGSFVNLKESAADYIRDPFNLELVSAEDYLYLGYFKPFNACYVALDTANANSNSFTAEYWDGSSWTSLDLTDESRGFTRSGFLFWDRSAMKSTSVNGSEAYYVRLKPDSDHSAASVRGINLVFADDNSLKEEFFEIDNSNLLPSGESNHLVHHVAARNTIVQRLRNMGYLKSENEDLTQWDLNDHFQIKQAAVMLALSKIFFLLSDSTEDTWWSKYMEYQKRYEEAFNLYVLSVDQDNDGQEDTGEASENRRSQRWLR